MVTPRDQLIEDVATRLWDVVRPEHPLPYGALEKIAEVAVAIIVERCAAVARACGRPVGAGDGDTFIPGTAQDAARQILALGSQSPTEKEVPHG